MADHFVSINKQAAAAVEETREQEERNGGGDLPSQLTQLCGTLRSSSAVFDRPTQGDGQTFTGQSLW